MRVAIGQLVQEVNHFSPVPTTLANFQAFGMRYGQELMSRFASLTELGGFMDALGPQTGVELAPTLAAWAMPAGKLDKQTHQFLRTRLLDELRKAGPLDGILLSLHGAMSAEDEWDVEGSLLEAIRHEWGADIPIVISLDHHANITKRIVESCDGLVGYHTEPHLDAYETGLKAGKIMLGLLRGENRPSTGWRKLPMIATGNLLAPEGPLGDFFSEADQLERREEVLAVSIFPEFPYSDTPELGWTVVAVTDDEPDLAQDIADGLATKLWETREQFLPVERPSPAEAVAKALATEGGPFVLGDFGDNTAGGATGDSTAVLQELLGKDLDGYAIVSVVDPEAVAACVEAGVGRDVTLELGGKIDRLHYEPVLVSGRVKTLSDGRYRAWGDLDVTMGRAAVLESGKIFVLLSELASPNVDPEIYRSVGLEPREAKLVLVKCAYNFTAYYGDFAKEMIVIDSPGVTAQDLRARADEFQAAPRPLFPLDESVTFEL
jgi:microcystin degradation protein MlrC